MWRSTSSPAARRRRRRPPAGTPRAFRTSGRCLELLASSADATTLRLWAWSSFGDGDRAGNGHEIFDIGGACLGRAVVMITRRDWSSLASIGARLGAAVRHGRRRGMRWDTDGCLVATRLGVDYTTKDGCANPFGKPDRCTGRHCALAHPSAATLSLRRSLGLGRNSGRFQHTSGRITGPGRSYADRHRARRSGAPTVAPLRVPTIR